MPTILSGPSTCAPATRIDPAVHGNRPVTSFISDDLPHPEGPTTAANSPRATLSVVPSSASVAFRTAVTQRDGIHLDELGRSLRAEAVGGVSA